MLLEPAWHGVADPIERIFALLADYRQRLVESDCTYGCPIGSLALELHEPDPPVRLLLAANFEGWIGHVQACLEQARDRIGPDTDTRRLATFILTVMEGGVMQARTSADDRAVRRLHRRAARLSRAAGPGQWKGTVMQRMAMVAALALAAIAAPPPRSKAAAGGTSRGFEHLLHRAGRRPRDPAFDRNPGAPPAGVRRLCDD